MAEKLVQLKKKGGGGGGTDINNMVQRSLSGSRYIGTNYTYITSGVFLSGSVSRGGLSNAPYVTVYTKVGDDYIQVSPQTRTTEGTTGISNNNIKLGEIYIKSTMAFTASNLYMTYLEEG